MLCATGDHAMPLLIFSALPLALALGVTQAPASASQQVSPQQMQATRAVAAELLQTLSGKLQESLRTEGPAGSIDFCRKVAPGLALGLADKTGWEISRVGTRVRNIDMGTPHGWQQQALQKIAADLRHGADPKTLEWHEIVIRNGQPRLHYAKAIVLQPQCLMCHGSTSNIPPTVAARIKLLYPHDQATGYAAGDLRGAVVISRPLAPATE
jgi:hypothetical protein